MGDLFILDVAPHALPSSCQKRPDCGHFAIAVHLGIDTILDIIPVHSTRGTAMGQTLGSTTAHDRGERPEGEDARRALDLDRDAGRRYFESPHVSSFFLELILASTGRICPGG